VIVSYFKERKIENSHFIWIFVAYFWHFPYANWQLNKQIQCRRNFSNRAKGPLFLEKIFTKALTSIRIFLHLCLFTRLHISETDDNVRQIRGLFML